MCDIPFVSIFTALPILAVPAASVGCGDGAIATVIVMGGSAAAVVIAIIVVVAIVCY